MHPKINYNGERGLHDQCHDIKISEGHESKLNAETNFLRLVSKLTVTSCNLQAKFCFHTCLKNSKSTESAVADYK